MIGTTEQVTDELIFCIALRHLGAEREVLVVKEREQEFFAFPPYAKKPLGSFDVHMSWHKSGERHFTVRLFNGHKWKKHKSTQEKSRVNLGAPANLKGVGDLYRSGIFLHQFLDYPPVGTNLGSSLVLDAESANFRDDFIAIRVYLVEAGREDQIPTYPATGPRILHLVRNTRPWIAIDVFQQTAA